MQSPADEMSSKRRRSCAEEDRFSVLPVSLLRVIFTFCALPDLVRNSTVCRAWRKWIAHPAALPTGHRLRDGCTGDKAYDWLGRCGVRWAECNTPERIGHALWPPEVVTDLFLFGSNLHNDVQARHLLQFRDRLRLTTLTWHSRAESEPADDVWERFDFLLSGLHTLHVCSTVSPNILRRCAALRLLHITLDGSVSWIPLIQAAPNQQFRIRVRIDPDEEFPDLSNTLAKLAAWSALRDRLDEVELVVGFSDDVTANEAAIARIRELRLPIVRLYVGAKDQMPRFAARDMPHLRELYWDLWHVIGRARVEAFLSVFNVAYNTWRV